MNDHQLFALYPEPLPYGWGNTGPLNCDHRLRAEGGPMTLVSFPVGPPDYPPDSFLDLRVHYKTEEAWSAYAAVMVAEGYWFGESIGGTINCRRKWNRDSGDPSTHAFGLALDLNPSRNRGSSDGMPKSFTRAIARIRTIAFPYTPVFKRLASDMMHYQIDTTPLALGSGVDWSTVAGADPLDPMEDDMNIPLTPALIRRAFHYLDPQVHGDPEYFIDGGNVRWDRVKANNLEGAIFAGMLAHGWFEDANPGSPPTGTFPATVTFT